MTDRPQPPSIAVLIASKDGSGTIQAAVRSARCQADVYVVDDGSTDDTTTLARATGASVLTLPTNRGKALALRSALDHRWNRLGGERLTERYSHICVVDDDVVLFPNYIEEMRRSVSRPDVAVAEGWSESHWPHSRRWNGWIAARALTTFRLQLITIPFQALVGTRMWLTGAHVVYRSDVLDEVCRRDLVFAVEDCDFAWQVQRERLGRIVFARRARAWWQQVTTFADLHRQHMRWYTGSWQALLHHGLGTRATRHDAWFALSVLELMLQVFWPLTLLGLYVSGRIPWQAGVVGLVGIYVALAAAGALAMRRWRLLLLWPYDVVYDLMWRYFFFRGLVRAWKNPSMTSGAWTSPQRTAGAGTAQPVLGTLGSTSPR